jgi:putative DNA primase/helicase
MFFTPGRPGRYSRAVEYLFTSGEGELLDWRQLPLGEFEVKPPPRLPLNSNGHTPTVSEVVDVASRAQNGAKFLQLWGGSTSGYNSHSEAELALVSLISFYCGGNEFLLDEAFRHSALMRDKWLRDDYRQRTISKALDSCATFYDWSKHRNGAAEKPIATPSPPPENVSQDTPQTENPTPALDTLRGRTESANAARLVSHYGKQFRYVTKWEKYVAWAGTHWELDGPAIEGYARQSAENLWQDLTEASVKVDGKTVGQMATFIKASTGATGIRNVLFLARSEPGIAINFLALDDRPMLFNCLNGTLDLETGQLRPHDPNDLITRCAPVTFDPGAKCPLWIKFLIEIFDGDSDLIDYIQRGLGYSLTGLIREAVLFFLHGAGRNGKSVFVSLIQSLLGDYATTLRSEFLMVAKGQEHPTEVSDFFGKRFASACEIEQGRRLAETRVKWLTGDDRLKARRMREDFWEFDATHKLWMSGNHKPRISGTDPAIWERIHLINFNQQYLADDPRTDTSLKDKLKAELSGILNWAIEGCHSWQRGGLCPPKAVTGATKKYREEEDVLGSFISECCELGEGLEVAGGALHAAYKDWGGTMSMRDLAHALDERGLLAVKATSGPNNKRMMRKGIALGSQQ